MIIRNGIRDYAAAQEYIRIYLAHVPDIVSKLRVQARSIRCASAVGDSLRAIEVGREGLAMAGVLLPDDAEEARQVEETVRSQLSLGVQDIEASLSFARALPSLSAILTRPFLHLAASRKFSRQR